MPTPGELTQGDVIADPRRDGEHAELIGFGPVHFASRSMMLALRNPVGGAMRAAHYGLDEDLPVITAVATPLRRWFES